MNEPIDVQTTRLVGFTERERRHMSARTTAPANERPYRESSAHGGQRLTYTPARSQLWRQVGWHGQTGAFYTLDEDPSLYEPGSFSPLWVLVADDEDAVVVIRGSQQ